VRATVDWTLSSETENLTQTGTAGLTGNGNELGNKITGNSGNSNLFGDAGNDTLIGGTGTGNDTLNGGTGIDSLTGGLGDDTYVIDHASDVMVEAAGEGSDTVQTDLDYTLLVDFENLVMTGAVSVNGTGNTVANAMTGNSIANVLTGLGGNDSIDGAAGNDTITGDFGSDVLTGGAGVDSVDGGAGTDVLVVAAAGDVAAGDFYEGGLGNDTLSGTVGTAVDLTGATFSGIEAITGFSGGVTLTSAQVLGFGNVATSGALTLADFGAIDLTTVAISTGTINLANGANTFTINDGGLAAYTINGNSGVDAITVTGGSLGATLNGNGGSDVLTGAIGNDNLIGGFGNDVLNGDAGNDTMDGGAGSDTMNGGQGDDTYVVNVSGDVTSEAGGSGTDTVQSAVTRTLATGFENLTLTGTASINGTGNGADNVLTGNSGDNVLTGSTGADQFVFTSTSAGFDTIADFNALDGGAAEGDVLVFAGLLSGTFAYLGDGVFSNTGNSEAVRLGNHLLVDTDGNGVADIDMILTGLTSAAQLTGADFLFT